MDSEKDRMEEGKLSGAGNPSTDKRKDFWKGFWEWFALNFIIYFFASLLVAFLPAVVPDEYMRYVFPSVLWLIPLAINIGLMIYYAKKNRPQVSIGMLSAFGITLTICLALSAVCFSTF